MAQKYKNKDLLKIQPFYSKEIKSAIKRKRKNSNPKIFTQKPKE